MKWEPYDPSWLVDAAQEHVPEELWLPEALAQCTRCNWESPAYVHFVDPSCPNEEGSEWQFDINIIIEHETEGDLVLDILKDRRVGGVEFLNRL